jgi:hypothetical protein
MAEELQSAIAVLQIAGSASGQDGDGLMPADRPIKPTKRRRPRSVRSGSVHRAGILSTMTTSTLRILRNNWSKVD